MVVAAAATAAAVMKMSPEERAQEILDMADETLAQVDASFIFSVKDCREFPIFSYDETSNGPLLGKGGFSGVYEVLKISLPKNESTTTTTATADDDTNDNDDHDDYHHHQHKKQESALIHEDSLVTTDQRKTDTAVKEQDEAAHYDVATAREFMSRSCLRNGSARYAIKRLKSDLSILDRARGAVDLAIEIKFLSAIWHPNIIKMRGFSSTPRVDVETFLLMDRLYGTLDDKIEEWEHVQAAHKGCCGVSDKNPIIVDMLKDRLLVAYDLSSAFNYLHGLRLLYRDIKPENIGFDIRGDVKLFDFGLCKSLEKSDKRPKGYGYQLTAKTGSIPYMAPEIALGKPYGQEADVFSFSVLLWELMSLEWAFNGYDTRTYFLRVCKEGQRLPIPRGWPAVIRTILQEGWDTDPQKRPNMKRIGSLIRGDLEDMTDDQSVLNRTQHMLSKSRRSLRGMGNGSQGRRSNMLGSRSDRHAFVGGDMCGSGHVKAPEK